MNVILKAWRKFKLVVAKRRQMIGLENKFQIGDFVHVKFGVGVDDFGGT